jgi:hypothetical protein
LLASYKTLKPKENLKITVDQRNTTKYGDIILKFKFANPLLVKRKAAGSFGVDTRVCEMRVKCRKKLIAFLLAQHPEIQPMIGPEFDSRI